MRLFVTMLLMIGCTQPLAAQRDSLSRYEFGIDQGAAVAMDRSYGSTADFPVTLRWGNLSRSRTYGLEMRLGLIERRRAPVSGVGLSTGVNVLLRLPARARQVSRGSNPYMTLGIAAVRADAVSRSVTVPAMNVGLGARAFVRGHLVRAELSYARTAGSAAAGAVGFLPFRSSVGMRLGYSLLR